jgi:methylmalonyl-CoA/ethylmalonyl-CoA epimerase
MTAAATSLDVRFDHAGVATDDAKRLATVYTDLLGCERVHETRFDGMEIHFLAVGDSYFELIEPVEPGPIQSYLDENSPGIHHLAVSVSDIESALEHARHHDVRLIDETPRPGAWDHDVAFLHPNSTGGVLIEFVQR